jgi:hypothetical protein
VEGKVGELGGLGGMEVEEMAGKGTGGGGRLLEGLGLHEVSRCNSFSNKICYIEELGNIILFFIW